MFKKKRVQKTVDCKSTSLFLVQSPVSYSVWIYNCNEKIQCCREWLGTKSSHKLNTQIIEND